MKYASIIPLIGGETIAMQQVFGKRPEYLLSYEAFSANDRHLVEYYNKEVPYYVLDNRSNNQFPNVDVVNTVCPCAGLSSLSPTSNGDSLTNDWMVNTAGYVLESLSPRVFWGENAPRLASKMGEPVVNKLKRIANDNGYTLSIFKTKSILHGLSQVRDRTFYFFWKGNKVPLFRYIKREHEKIEETIRSVKRDPSDPMNVLTNKRVPSENPYYKYVLQEIEGGITHQEFVHLINKTTNPMHYIEEKKVSYLDVAKWMKQKGYEKESIRCEVVHKKLLEGGNIMRKLVEIPKGHIGAFVGHFPTQLTHPDEDRFLTIREALSIMKLPKDFMLQGGVRNVNHICQNVPVTTAYDMAWHVQEHLLGNLETIETPFLIQDNKSQSYEYEKQSLQLDTFMV